MKQLELSLPASWSESGKTTLENLKNLLYKLWSHAFILFNKSSLIIYLTKMCTDMQQQIHIDINTY